MAGALSAGFYRTPAGHHVCTDCADDDEVTDVAIGFIGTLARFHGFVGIVVELEHRDPDADVDCELVLMSTGRRIGARFAELERVKP